MIKLTPLLRLLSIVGISLLFTGCFEIVEEIDLKEDGSGTFALTFNLSQSKSKLSSIMLLDSINGFYVPKKEDIEFHLKRLKNILEDCDSLKNVRIEKDFDEFIFAVKVDFDDLNDLNSALINVEKVYGIQNSKEKDPHFEYEKSTGSFNRSGNYIFTEGVKNIATDNSEVSSTAEYISICRFDREVNQVNNENALISPSRKAVMIRKNMEELIFDTSVLDNKIVLK